MIKNINDSFRSDNDSASMNKVLEFLVNLVWTETHFVYILGILYL